MRAGPTCSEAAVQCRVLVKRGPSCKLTVSLFRESLYPSEWLSFRGASLVMFLAEAFVRTLRFNGERMRRSRALSWRDLIGQQLGTLCRERPARWPARDGSSTRVSARASLSVLKRGKNAPVTSVIVARASLSVLKRGKNAPVTSVIVARLYRAAVGKAV